MIDQTSLSDIRPSLTSANIDPRVLLYCGSKLHFAKINTHFSKTDWQEEFTCVPGEFPGGLEVVINTMVRGQTQKHIPRMDEEESKGTTLSPGCGTPLSWSLGK